MNTKSIALLLLVPLTMSAESVVAQDVGVMPVVVSLEFAGGTMAEFVDLVREVQPKANVVLATGARDAQVPALVLKSAGLEQALQGACMVVAVDYDVRVSEFRGIGEPVFSIIGEQRRQVTTPRSSTVIEPAVFSTSNLTIEREPGMKPLAMTTILSAIELTMADEQVAPSIRFHEDSGLLLIRGSRAQINLVEITLTTLERDLDRRESRIKRMRFESLSTKKSAK